MNSRPRETSDSDPLDALRKLLDTLRARRRTMTYREAAEALELGPPHRIRQLTRMLEQILAEDATAGRPPRAALIVSRIRDGMPAPGFFERAKALGLCRDETPALCQRRWLDTLFEAPPRSADTSASNPP